MRIMEELTLDEINTDIMLLEDLMKLFIENKVDVSDQGGSEAETRMDYIESINRVKHIFDDMYDRAAHKEMSGKEGA